MKNEGKESFLTLPAWIDLYLIKRRNPLAVSKKFMGATSWLCCLYSRGTWGWEVVCKHVCVCVLGRGWDWRVEGVRDIFHDLRLNSCIEDCLSPFSSILEQWLWPGNHFLASIIFSFIAFFFFFLVLRMPENQAY